MEKSNDNSEHTKGEQNKYKCFHTGHKDSLNSVLRL